MFNYINSAETASKLIEKFGRTITHRRITLGTYDPNTDTFIVAGGGGQGNMQGQQGATNVDTTIKACDFAVNGQDFVNNTLIQEGDRYALIEPKLVNIVMTDQLIIGADTWSIIRIEDVAPAGVVVLFKVYIRK